MYFIHSMVRSRTNRTQRAGQPRHLRFKQYLFGGKYRLIRGRRIQISEEELKANLQELIEKEQAQVLKVVKASDGTVVDLGSLVTGSLKHIVKTLPPPAPKKVEVPKPTPPPIVVEEKELSDEDKELEAMIKAEEEEKAKLDQDSRPGRRRRK